MSSLNTASNFSIFVQVERETLPNSSLPKSLANSFLSMVGMTSILKAPRINKDYFFKKIRPLENIPFDQVLRQAQIVTLEILNVFLRSKFKAFPAQGRGL